MTISQAKSQALAIAWHRYPGADDIRLCLTHGEMLAEVWERGKCLVVHTEVYV